MELKVFWKEHLYFWLSLVVTIGVYYLIIDSIISLINNPQLLTTMIVFLVYIVFIVLYVVFMKIILIGHLQGNAVRITEKQFPEIFTILTHQCIRLQIKKAPTMYLIQSGGILNAFATRFMGRNYVVIYSDIMEKAFSDGTEVVEFIIGHELTHIKQNHLIKRLLIMPANLLFLLTLAYSRACEITCDSFASVLSPNGAEKGLVLLAAGKNLYSRVNIMEYIKEAENEKTFAKWFSEKMSTHPHITKRLSKLLLSQEVRNNQE